MYIKELLLKKNDMLLCIFIILKYIRILNND